MTEESINQKYQNLMIGIVVGSLIVTNTIFVMWLLHDKQTLLYDIIVALVFGSVTGLSITIYFRLKDRNDRISRSAYGLQIHLFKIKIRIDDIIYDKKKYGHEHKSEVLINRLRETLIDSPYEIFLDLSNDQIISGKLSDARKEASKLITKLDSEVIENDDLWDPPYNDLIKIRANIAQCRFNLLRSKHRK